MKKPIKTSLPFPIQQIVVDVDYKKVEKPSGVSYFLLVLISETKNRSENISKLLIRFGIPESLHDIFAIEMGKLITDGIITFKRGIYNPVLFSNYEIEHLEMTQLGQKIFADEVIPTGDTITKTITVWYDPKTDTYSSSHGRQAGSIESNTLTDAFCKSFEKSDDEDLRQFIEARKNSDFGLKREEAIVNVNVARIVHMYSTYDVQFDLDTDGTASVSYEDAFSERFAQTNYDTAFIQRTMDAKKKFHIGNMKVFKQIEFKTFGQIDDLVLPRDLPGLVNQKDSLAIASDGTYVPADAIVSRHAFPDRPDVTCALLTSPGKASLLTLGRFEFRIDEPGWDIWLNLVVHDTLTEDDAEKLVDHALGLLGQRYSKESLGQLVRLYNLTHDQEKVIQKFESLIPVQVEDALEVLKTIKGDGLVLPKAFLEAYRKESLRVADSILMSIRKETVDSWMSSMKWLYDEADLPQVEQISKLATQLKVEETDVPHMYKMLVDHGYGIRNVLPFFNTFDLYAGRVIRKIPIDRQQNDLATDFAQVLSGYTTMLQILGINDYTDLVTREDIDNAFFIRTYKATMRVVEKLSTFKKLSPNFETITKAMDTFRIISDILETETKAWKNPQSITRKQIESFRRSGDVLNVIIYLSVKLENVLARLLDNKDRLVDMIKDARKKGFIDRKEEDLLHNMRKQRNSFVHDTGIVRQMADTFLEEVIPIVFRLEDKLDEQSRRD